MLHNLPRVSEQLRSSRDGAPEKRLINFRSRLGFSSAISLRPYWASRFCTSASAKAGPRRCQSFLQFRHGQRFQIVLRLGLRCRLGFGSLERFRIGCHRGYPLDRWRAVGFVSFRNLLPGSEVVKNFRIGASRERQRPELCWDLQSLTLPARLILHSLSGLFHCEIVFTTTRRRVAPRAMQQGLLGCCDVGVLAQPNFQRRLLELPPWCWSWARAVGRLLAHRLCRLRLSISRKRQKACAGVRKPL